MTDKVINGVPIKKGKEKGPSLPVLTCEEAAKMAEATAGSEMGQVTAFMLGLHFTSIEEHETTCPFKTNPGLIETVRQAVLLDSD